MYVSRRKYTEEFVSSFETDQCELTQSHQYADLPQLKFLSCAKIPLTLDVNQLFSNQRDPDPGGFTSTKGRKKLFSTFCLVISSEALTGRCNFNSVLFALIQRWLNYLLSSCSSPIYTHLE